MRNFFLKEAVLGFRDLAPVEGVIPNARDKETDSHAVGEEAPSVCTRRESGSNLRQVELNSSVLRQEIKSQTESMIMNFCILETLDRMVEPNNGTVGSGHSGERKIKVAVPAHGNLDQGRSEIAERPSQNALDIGENP